MIFSLTGIQTNNKNITSRQTSTPVSTAAPKQSFSQDSNRAIGNELSQRKEAISLFSQVLAPVALALSSVALLFTTLKTNPKV